MKKVPQSLAFLLLIVFIACEDNISPQQTIPNDTIRNNTLVLNFDHTVDGQGLVYNEMIYQNAATNKYSVMTLRYYISDIRLHKYDGTVVKLDTFIYRDIDIPETRTLTINNVPDDQYTFVSFIFGLDSIRNESYGLPPTQENNNMEWPIPMGGGYHYMKLEGRFVKDDGSIGSYNTHFGRLKTSEGKIHENFIHVSLPSSAFAMDGDRWHIQVLMNINQWYKNPNIYDIEEFGPAIMGNQQVQQILKENGKNAFSIGYMFKEI